MRKIINAFLLLFISSIVYFLFAYFKNFDLEYALQFTSKYLIILSATSLFISIIFKTTHKTSLVLCIVYSIIIVCADFYIKNNDIIYPETKTPALFENIYEFPLKKGIIIQNDISCFSFGVTARFGEGKYLIKNVFFRSNIPSEENYSLYAEYGKIIDRKLILYKGSLIKDNKFIPSEKNYEVPLSFNSDLIFDLWNENNKINLKTALPSLHSLTPFRLPILLLLGSYAVNLMILLIISSIALAAQNLAVFTKGSFLGIIASYITVYHLCLLLSFYGSIIMQTLINII